MDIFLFVWLISLAIIDQTVGEDGTISLTDPCIRACKYILTRLHYIFFMRHCSSAPISCLDYMEIWLLPDIPGTVD